MTEELGIDRLEEATVIGRGGQATVYRARDPQMHRDVAVKVFTGTDDPAGVDRELNRELRALGQLTGHPHIVTVFRTGLTTNSTPYVEMEYVAGGSMWARSRELGGLPEHDVTRLGSQLASALASAHRLGLIHRDVKPSNVLLTADGDAKLADFGIASVGSGSTTTGSDHLRYTLAYAPPEVLSGGAATPAGDVYSLGLTLIAALSGKAPFQGTGDESLQGVIGRVLSHQLPDPAALGASPTLTALLRSATAKDPNDRPPANVRRPPRRNHTSPYAPARTHIRVPARRRKYGSHCDTRAVRHARGRRNPSTVDTCR